MGWFSGWFGSSSSSNNSSISDPLRDLDPSLRDFLEKESPVKYQPSAPPPLAPKPTNEPTDSTSTTSTTTENSAPLVPPESLYQDGRYAHLWSTYKSRNEVEAATKSDQEKLMDVLEGYKSRKAMIGKAALENCALEHLALSDCYMSGNWKSYLSARDRPPEIDERIQMHADTLYHRMLDQERAVEAAKQSDLPIPEFPPLVTAEALPSNPTTSTGQPISASASALLSSAQPMSHDESKTMYLKRILPPDAIAQQEKEWDRKEMTAEERMLEARAMAMEAEAGMVVASQVGQMMQETKKGKEERRAKGTAGIGDRVSGWLGW
ncbi:MAG: hypothetical protein L6R40_000375 [Gallowayella cf. fulva]|nr:MAG: hypothetical protein L6R40_000375 [Xanthomendoza cf. fulva]